MTYGGGSIKRNGLYDLVKSELAAAGCTVFELSGIEPNPRVTSVDAGAKICKEQGVDLVLAVGGGSTMDASKAICAAACYSGPAWDLVLDNSKIKAALPLFTINTIAATGSEYDNEKAANTLEQELSECCNEPTVHPEPDFEAEPASKIQYDADIQPTAQAKPVTKSKTKKASNAKPKARSRSKSPEQSHDELIEETKISA